MQKVFSIQLKGRQRFLRLIGDSSKAKGLASGLVTLKPKESIGLHNTKDKEEALVILSGQALVSYGRNKMIKVKAVSFVFIPPKTDHDVKNTGTDKLSYVYLTARL